MTKWGETELGLIAGWSLLSPAGNAEFMNCSTAQQPGDVQGL